MAQCIVCGSSAPYFRVREDSPPVNLCAHHRYVCNPHLEDPCHICDTT